MGKYAEASKFYNELVAAWKRFEEGRDIGHNHGLVVNNAINLAKLGLPNPWEGMKDEEPEPQEEKKEEAETEDTKEEPKDESKEDRKEESSFAKPQVNNFRRDPLYYKGGRK